MSLSDAEGIGPSLINDALNNQIMWQVLFWTATEKLVFKKKKQASSHCDKKLFVEYKEVASLYWYWFPAGDLLIGVSSPGLPRVILNHAISRGPKAKTHGHQHIA